MRIIRKFLIPINISLLVILSHCNPDDAVEVLLPELSETTVSEISTTGAKFDATIESDGGGEVFTKGFVYNTTGAPNENDEKLISISDLEKISASTSNLLEDSKYYVRAYAINSKGIAFGDESEFTTSKAIVEAEVTTDLISEIEFTSVMASGTVSNEGNGTVSERGFVWSTMENPTIELETKVKVGGGLGSFSITIENLAENTTYFIRAYVINEFGILYGDELTFTTLNSNTLFEEIEFNSDLSLFTSELKNHPDLMAILDGESSEYTLLVPNNDAMNSLFQIFEVSSFETFRYELVKEILAYHITPQLLYSSDLSDPASFRTLQGEQFTIDVDGTIISGATSRAAFIERDINASNGVMHIIDQIIIPPTIGALITSSLGTVAEPIVLGKDFSILYEAMKKADEGKEPHETIMGTLQSATNVTFFSPTNATFEAAVITVDIYDSYTWDAIIRNHILVEQGDESLTEADLIDGSSFTTILGGTLTFIHGTPNNGTGIFIDSDNDYDVSNPASTLDGEIFLFDAAVKSNGRIHVIAGILVPET